MPITTYSQPNIDAAVRAGQDFVRISQVASGPGDIYETPQSGYAFAVGPLSDFENYNIAYWDRAQGTTKLSQIAVGPGAPFIGNVSASNNEQYLPSGRPGVSMFYPTDIWKSNYLPDGFDPITDRMLFERPMIDVIQYFTPRNTPSTAARVNKVYSYTFLPFGDIVYIAIPFYGRRYASMLFRNNLGTGIDVSITGINFMIIQDDQGGPLLKEVLAPATIADGASSSKVVKADVDGMYDYLLFKYNATLGGAAGDSPVRIVVSDSITGQ